VLSGFNANNFAAGTVVLFKPSVYNCILVLGRVKSVRDRCPRPESVAGGAMKVAWLLFIAAVLTWSLSAQMAGAEGDAAPCGLTTFIPPQGGPPLVSMGIWLVPVPNDVALRLSPTHGQSVYQEGEIISLELAYTASGKKKYTADTRNYDRISQPRDSLGRLRREDGTSVRRCRCCANHASI
jgi:hypothetical protein